MRGKQWRWSITWVPVLLAAVVLWRPVGVIAGNATTTTNLPVIVRKTAPYRQFPAQPQSAPPQSELYVGSRVKSITSTLKPQNPYESDYASLLHAYHKAIVGFRLALTSRVYLFVGVGLAVPNDLLKQGWGQDVSITTDQIRNALVMQTEYGLGWDF